MPCSLHDALFGSSCRPEGNLSWPRFNVAQLLWGRQDSPRGAAVLQGAFCLHISTKQGKFHNITFFKKELTRETCYSLFLVGGRQVFSVFKVGGMRKRWGCKSEDVEEMERMRGCGYEEGVAMKRVWP